MSGPANGAMPQSDGNGLRGDSREGDSRDGAGHDGSGREGVGREGRLPPAEGGDFVAALRAFHARLLFGVGMDARSGPWRPGRGRSLARELSEGAEEIVRACARRAGEMPRSAVLAAMGGCGRGELAPHSDLDVLLAFADAPNEDSRAWAASLLRLLWDSGLKANLGVRTFRECQADVDDDFDFLTSLVAGRPLLGDDAAFHSLARRLAEKKRGAALSLLCADSDSLARSLFGDPASIHRGKTQRGEEALEVFSREPDLKEGYGALRSLHRMEWLGLFAGDEGGREAWKGLFSEREIARIEAAYDFQLWLRILLHDRKGREADLLGHDDFEAIGREYRSGPGGDADRGPDLGGLLVQARRRLALAEFAAREAFGPRKRRHLPLPEAVIARANPDAPASVLELFVPIAEGRQAISAALLRDAAERARREPPLLSDRPTFDLFRRILSAPAASLAVAALDAASILRVIVPHWAAARDLWSDASFHDRPVGPHSIQALRVADTLLGPDRDAARRFSEPIAAIASRYLDTGWIVRLALVLHDLGKAFPGDHAKNGATLAEKFLAPLPTEALIKDMIASLVEDHLLLSNASRRVDSHLHATLDDLVAEFADRSFPDDGFGLLAVVTACDMAATNSGAWAGYRRSRFERLVVALDARLAAKEGRSTRERLLADKLVELGKEGGRKEVAAFALRLGERYILAHGPEEIARAFALWKANGHDRVDIDVAAENDQLRVRIVAPDEPGLFASLAGILLANGADIVSADIHSLDGVAIDEFRITEVFGNDLLARAMERELSLWTKELERSLRHYLVHTGELALCVFGLERGSRKVPQVFRAPAKVQWAREEGGLRFEISCTDRPALLYDLAHSLSLSGFDTRAASIETRGFRVHDCFHVAPRASVLDAALDAFASELAATCERPVAWPSTEGS